jgi:hypothetical protein
MNAKLTRTERSAFLFFGGAVLILTIVATPSILIITLLNYLFEGRNGGSR